jgi:riboflavin transporter FmnP
MKLRTDSRSIAILAIFAAMVLALEIIPIPFLTDIPLFGGFTLDPTGVPITIVFLALGTIFSLILIPIMWVAIAYRNPIGAAFKGFAETYTLLGLIVAKIFLRKRLYDWKVALPAYLVFGVVFRAIGMYITNIFLIQWLYGSPLEGAIILSGAFVIPNIVQALINIIIGVIVFIIIPENLAIQARFGKYGTDEYGKYEEISTEELEATDDDTQTD